MDSDSDFIELYSPVFKFIEYSKYFPCCSDNLEAKAIPVLHLIWVEQAKKQNKGAIFNAFFMLFFL